METQFTIRSVFRLPVAAVIFSCWLSSAASGQTYTPGQDVDKDYDGFAKTFLSNYCVDCHSGGDPEGNLSLDDLGPVDEVTAATWRSVWAQVTLKEMPPKDMDQPEVVQRLQFSDWIVGEMTRVMRDKGGFRAALDPNKGNFVDHDLLFGSNARWRMTFVAELSCVGHIARGIEASVRCARCMISFGTQPSFVMADWSVVEVVRRCFARVRLGSV